MAYMKRSFNHHCKLCGVDISDRSASVEVCLDCKKKLDKEKAARKKQHQTELEARDTVVSPIKEKRLSSVATDREYTYLICPSCNCVLNKQDVFCRFCGQRIKTGGTE